jgi:hypothetical protein
MKAIGSIILIVIFTLSSCDTKQDRTTIPLTFTAALPKDSSTFYFPTNTFYKDTNENKRSADQFTNKWYSKILFNLKEPILSSYSGESEAIRFIWLRTFNEPIVVRLNNAPEGIIANLKALKGHSGFKTGNIKLDTAWILDKTEWTKAIQKLNDNNFWAASSESESTGKDGVDWVLEVRTKEKYHFINRWDDGNMQSNDLKLFCSDLISLCKGVVDLRSSR